MKRSRTKRAAEDKDGIKSIYLLTCSSPHSGGRRHAEPSGGEVQDQVSAGGHFLFPAEEPRCIAPACCRRPQEPPKERKNVFISFEQRFSSIAVAKFSRKDFTKSQTRP